MKVDFGLPFRPLTFGSDMEHNLSLYSLKQLLRLRMRAVRQAPYRNLSTRTDLPPFVPVVPRFPRCLPTCSKSINQGAAGYPYVDWPSVLANDVQLVAPAKRATAEPPAEGRPDNRIVLYVVDDLEDLRPDQHLRVLRPEPTFRRGSRGQRQPLDSQEPSMTRPAFGARWRKVLLTRWDEIL